MRERRHKRAQHQAHSRDDIGDAVRDRGTSAACMCVAAEACEVTNLTGLHPHISSCRRLKIKTSDYSCVLCVVQNVKRDIAAIERDIIT